MWAQLSILRIERSLRGAEPEVRIAGDAAGLRVTFPAGQVWGCVVFRSLTETIQEGRKTVPYEPRKCGPLSRDATSLTEDWSLIEERGNAWDVYAFVQTERDGKVGEPVRSNVIRVIY